MVHTGSDRFPLKHCTIPPSCTLFTSVTTKECPLDHLRLARSLTKCTVIYYINIIKIIIIFIRRIEICIFR